MKKWGLVISFFYALIVLGLLFPIFVSFQQVPLQT